jgi:hypothetical protein
MQSFTDMAEAHAWTLQRLREMAGRLTEQAYRMARGLRLSIALEAKLARERRWDADELCREAMGERHAPRWRRPEDRAAAQAPRSQAPRAETEPAECDREQDDDGLPADAPLGARIARIKAIVEAGFGPEPDAAAQAAARAFRARTSWMPDASWRALAASMTDGAADGGEPGAPDDPPAVDSG